MEVVGCINQIIPNRRPSTQGRYSLVKILYLE